MALGCLKRYVTCPGSEAEGAGAEACKAEARPTCKTDRDGKDGVHAQRERERMGASV